MTWSRRLLALAAVCALCGCSPRDHDNPLDPENPATGGRPQWLDALADDGAVDLAWSVPRYVDLDGVRLRETTGGEILWTGRAGTDRLRHAGLVNGIERGYRLELVLDNGRTIELPEVPATPGAAIPWVYDFGRGEVVRLTPDGRRRRDGFFDGATLSVVADSDSGDVLVVDFFAGRIIRLDRDAQVRWRRDEYVNPNAALRVRGGWWVTDSGLGSIRRLDEAGTPRYENLEFRFPLDVVPAADSAVWVAAADGPVGRLVPGRGFVALDTLASPRVLAPAPDGGVWVSDPEAAALVRLDPEARETGRIPGYGSVEAMALDPATGGLWVGDRSRRRLVLLDPAGSPLVVVPGLPAVTGLAVSPDGAEVWAADPVLGEVLRLSRDGLVLGRSEGLSAPVSLSIAFRSAP